MAALEKQTLVLIDSHAVLHRAFHALPDFVSPGGEPTGALYGFTTTLLKVLKDFNPSHIAACYDLPEPTFRHVSYKNYKAKRPKTDEGLALQIDKSKEILRALGIPVYEKAGFEADDILASIVEQLGESRRKAGASAETSGLKTIITTGDLDTLQLVDDDVSVYTMKRGIQDSVLYDEKAVIERFGFDPKSLPDYKGLMGDPSDNIIGIPGIGEKTAKILIKNFGNIENLYKKLKTEKVSLEKIGIKERIIKLLEEHEEEALFSKVLAETRKDVDTGFFLGDCEWPRGFNKEKSEEIFKELGFRSLVSRLSGFGEKKEPEDKPFSSATPEISESVEKELKIAFWLLDSRRANPKLEEIFSYTGSSSAKEAAAFLISELEKNGMKKLFEEMEKPLIPILSEMEKTGILLDVDYLKLFSKDCRKKLESAKKKIWKLAGVEFNVSSPKQLGDVLFNKMGISAKGLRKTGGGALSTKFSELEKLRDRHEIIEEIFSYRELAKLTTTYIDNLPGLVDKENRLHTTFVQTGTTTGRLSSTDPNLQNIPIRTELGRGVRKAFISPKGFSLLSCDYSQIELRVAASLSGDKKLTKAFNEGKDIHNKVASEVFNVPFDKVDAEMRRRAKVINFGIIYGMGVNSLKKNLNCTREEAELFYDEYFNDFSGMSEYIEKIKMEARKKSFTETFFKRRRYLPEINSPVEYIRKEAERMAINAPIQGTAADIIKIAMVDLGKKMAAKEFSGKARLLLQVHDELLFEVRDDIIEEIASLAKEEMEKIRLPEVPILIEAKIGKNWAEMKKLSVIN
ncbi:MAG: DNA polymerase [Candidatus Pacebacteria bacterium]|nr:DNA polymerase [Candidatus Paceibacterota bacterium]